MVMRKPTAAMHGALRVLVAVALLLSPAFTRPASAIVNAVPLLPVQEENEEEKTGEEANAKELASSRPDRRVQAPASYGVLQPPPSSVFVRHSALPRAAVLDHFRNGLGTPFRC